MKFEVVLKESALYHLELFKKEGDKKVLKKIFSLVEELKEHPKTGTGKPERLKGELNRFWSRRITSKHRMVYVIEENIIKVSVTSLRNHYNDK